MRLNEAQIASLDEALEAIVADNPELSRRRDILLSIPGLGRVTPQALLAEMPEFGSMDEALTAALTGLAPVTRHSGKWQGKRASFKADASLCARHCICPRASLYGSPPTLSASTAGSLKGCL